MEGIQYIVDNKGNRKAVVIDLKRYQELWEDFEDQLLALKRRKQKKYTHAEVKVILKQEGKL